MMKVLHPLRLNLPDDSPIVDASCGWKHTIIVNVRNEIFTFGWNVNGACGCPEEHRESFEPQRIQITE